MIEAPEFIEGSRQHGFGLWTGVPCSFLTPLIDCAIEHPSLRWVGAANEGEAVAIAAGWALGGQLGVAIMQNSGLGNAVSPLSSLTHTLRIPVLLIVTLRGDPDLRDEPQHALMGSITERMLELLQIPWEAFPTERAAIGPALDRARKHMEAESRPYALVLRKGSVAPYAARSAGDRPADPRASRFGGIPRTITTTARPTRAQALQHIVDATPESSAVVVATTGYTSRELCAIADRASQLYVVGSMGCASSVGLGVSLASPGVRVVVVDGDGAALMRMGAIATLGRYGRDNLVHIVLDNGMHESTGGQPTLSGSVSFAVVAAACGYAPALEGDDLAVLDTVLDPTAAGGPRFAALKIRPGVEREPPRPKLSPEQVRARFADHLRKTAGAARVRGGRS